MRNPFMFAEFAAKTSFPNGSTPGTRNTTSSDINFSTVAVSPALVAASQFSTRARISCSSFCIIFSPANLQVEPGRVATKLQPLLGSNPTFDGVEHSIGFRYESIFSYNGRGGWIAPLGLQSQRGECVTKIQRTSTCRSKNRSRPGAERRN